MDTWLVRGDLACRSDVGPGLRPDRTADRGELPATALRRAARTDELGGRRFADMAESYLP